MITAVVMENDTDMTFNENAYPGMSLAEACKQFEMDIMSAINEFQMDILLKEHAYLYENGCEITYVDEAKNENENGKNLKDNFVNLCYTVVKKFKEIVDKIIAFILQRVEDVREFFMKKGITKNMAANAIKVYNKLCSDGTIKKVSINMKKVNKGEIDDIKKYTNLYLKAGAGDGNSAYGEEKEYEIDSDLAAEAFDAVYNTDKTLIKRLHYAKKEEERAIKAVINDIKNKKDVSTDIDKMKEALMDNKVQATFMAKLYREYLANNIAVIRKIFGVPEVRQACFAATKAGIKAAPGKAANAVADGAKAAGSAVAGAPGKAAGAAKKAFTKKEKATNESAEVDSEVYDGNYFRV